MLNEFGEDFRMSGYGRFAGQELAPTTPDIELLQGALTIPVIPPVAFRADFGFDFQQVRRQAADGSSATRTGNSFDLNELELLAETPLENTSPSFCSMTCSRPRLSARRGRARRKRRTPERISPLRPKGRVFQGWRSSSGIACCHRTSRPRAASISSAASMSCRWHSPRSIAGSRDHPT